MDIQLPKISGIEAMRRLRADPVTANTPIIVITSFALSGDDQKAKGAGATAYIAKPYSPRDLLTLLRKTLPRSLSLFAGDGLVGFEQLGQVVLPQPRHGGRAVAACLLAARDQDVAALLNPLDLALHDAELGRVALVVGGVDRP
jgi:DNA-binding response OmpR family regulator